MRAHHQPARPHGGAGIIDNHDHIILLGLRPGHDTRIENARSILEVLSTLAARAREVPAGDWITSLGRLQHQSVHAAAAAPRFPTLAELDTVTPIHPVLILQSFTGRASPIQKAGRSSRRTT